jgi:hypothetical protein
MGYAAIYNLYNISNQVSGKVILQNSDTDFFIGLDLINFRTGNPSNPWGFSVFFDIDHNGILTSLDRQVRFTSNSSGDFVEFLKYDSTIRKWTMTISGSLGAILVNGMEVDSSFTTSTFENTVNHRQYEMKIPFTVIAKSPGEMIGFAVEASENFNSQISSMVWPFIETNQQVIRTNPLKWGDLFFEEQYDSYTDYVVKKNFNIKPSAIGKNNGTFIETGDINGDGDLELIVASNRTVVVDNYLLAIYDYIAGEYQKIWSSWQTSHQSKITTVLSGLATHDFDGDSKEEIFAVGTNNKILRFYDWNSTASDFDFSAEIYTHTSNFMGYVSIGDFINDGSNCILAGDQNGNIVALVYQGGNSFSHDFRSPFSISSAERIHALQVADMDDDATNELLFFGQTSTDNTLSPTSLFIYQRFENKKLEDNLEDDLPSTSSSSTNDFFGHTILVADVDNQPGTETIIIGKNSLKIFSNDSFSDPTIPIEISLNDGTSYPSMAGGVEVGDINSDSTNEIVFSANNGSIYVGYITSTGSTFNFHLNWSIDLGSTAGKGNSIKIFDFDKDGEKEIIFGDTMGQIFILGLGKNPNITITNPNTGDTFASETIAVKWKTTSEFIAVHHHEIYVNSIFQNRIGGAMNSFEVTLDPGENTIEMKAISVTGLSNSDTVSVNLNVQAPQVIITSPENFEPTSQDHVIISYNSTDLDGDFDHYEIWLNDTRIEENTQQESYNVNLPSDGIWNITVCGVDTTGLAGKASIFLIRDTGKPSITITSPQDGVATRNTEQDIIWVASDALTSVKNFKVIVDGAIQETLTGYTTSVQLTVDKAYTIEVIAFDTVDNNASDSIIITRDTISPSITINTLSRPQLGNGIYYTDNNLLPISWNGTDNTDGSGIDKYELTINGLLYNTYTSSETTDTIDLGTNGDKSVKLTIFDSAGNSNYDEFTIILDTIAPNLSISIPQDNYTTGLDYVIVSWNANDVGVGILKYDVFVDGLLEAEITDEAITFYQITFSSEKSYLITIKATDILGYFSEKSINVIYNSSAPTVTITTPNTMTYFENKTEFEVAWDVNNLDINYFEIYVNGTLNQTLAAGIRSTVINLGFIPIDLYPVYNISIYAITNLTSVYFDMRWFIIDQSIPEISFLAPINPLIINKNLEVSWSSTDIGSGLDYFIVRLGIIEVEKTAESSFNTLLDVTSLNGEYNLFIYAYDQAGNIANISMIIEVSLSAPQYLTTLEERNYYQNGNFQFNLTLTNTYLGVKIIQVIADNINTVYLEDFGTNYLTTNEQREISVQDSDFTDSTIHNLTVSVFDRISRETRTTSEIIFDSTLPTFLQAPTFDGNLLGTTNKINFAKDPINNFHNLSIFIQDETGIRSAQVRIIGKNYDRIFEMTLNRSIVSLYEFDIQLDFNELALGDYDLIFTFEDLAGNINSRSYSFTLIEPNSPIRPNRTLIILISLAAVIILGFIGAIAFRKNIMNIGWKHEIVVVSYVLKSGLTVFFMPYTPQLVTDEQLFGGAMSGIRGILEEIIGKKKKNEVETVEFGERHLLIYTGDYGDAVLTVSDIKPIHSKRLREFAIEFEKRFRSQIKNDTHIDMSNYDGVIDLVEEYFGPRDLSEGIAFKISNLIKNRLIRKKGYDEKSTELEQDKEMMLSKLQENIFSNEGSASKLSQQTKIHIGDAVVFVEKALTSLMEYNYKKADVEANASLNSLELARKSGEPIELLGPIVEAIPVIVEQILNGIESGKAKDERGYKRAIENASQIFLEQIS